MNLKPHARVSDLKMPASEQMRERRGESVSQKDQGNDPEWGMETREGVDCRAG